MHQVWDEAECILYWARIGLSRTEHELRTVLHAVTLAYPLGRDLYRSQMTGGQHTERPAEDEAGAALTRTRTRDPEYPRQMYPSVSGPEDDGDGTQPDSDYMEYPSSPREALQEGLFPGKISECWPTFGSGRYPDFAIEGTGPVPMPEPGPGAMHGGMLAPADFPFRSGTDGRPLFFGNAVDNAVQVISNEASTLPDYNLDADYGYGWLCWRPAPGTFPADPPIHPNEAG